MNSLHKCLIAVVTVGATVSGASAAVLSIDNFESYTNNQDLATSASSTPWRRFGQVNDDFFAKTGAAMDGALGAQIPVGITGTGQAILQKSYVAAPLNLSSYATATVLSKSLSTTGSTTAALQLSITDGNTTYQSTLQQAETLASTTYTFGLTTADLVANGGTESLATVLSSVTYVGFRITSLSGASTETLAFDDFAVQTGTAVPEPASLSLLGLGALAAAGRRRR